jgi:hypothetical protein
VETRDRLNVRSAKERQQPRSNATQPTSGLRLRSALWQGRDRKSAGTMPNGDPPSLMLWGNDEKR